MPDTETFTDADGFEPNKYLNSAIKKNLDNCIWSIFAICMIQKPGHTKVCKSFLTFIKWKILCQCLSDFWIMQIAKINQMQSSRFSLIELLSLNVLLARNQNWLTNFCTRSAIFIFLLLLLRQIHRKKVVIGFLPILEMLIFK